MELGTKPNASTRDLLRARLRQALAARERLLRAGDSDAMRIVHGESDGLPGVIVDRYGDVVVLQLLSAGAERWRGELADAVRELTGCACVYERSDADVRALEGLPARSGVLHGALPGAGVQLREHGLAYGVDVAAGHKTGFYLDQRDNRKRIGELSQGREVLNCFCYTGGFSLNALAGGAASVLSVDSSAGALAQARDNLARNDLDAARAEWHEADVFKQLRVLRDQGRSFDLIVLDPPKFAPTAAFAEKAARGYKDINLLALQAAARRRIARELLLFRRRLRRSVPENPRRRGARRRRGRVHRRPLCRRRRPSGAAVLPRGRLPERAAAAARLGDNRRSRRKAVPAVCRHC